MAKNLGVKFKRLKWSPLKEYSSSRNQKYITAYIPNGRNSIYRIVIATLYLYYDEGSILIDFNTDYSRPGTHIPHYSIDKLAYAKEFVQKSFLYSVYQQLILISNIADNKSLFHSEEFKSDVRSKFRYYSIYVSRR